MIRAVNVCQLARLQINDAVHTTFSDFECLTALDTAIHLFVEACDQTFTPALSKTVELELTDERADLPEDFRSVLSVADVRGRILRTNYETAEPFPGEYRFENMQVVAPEPAVVLYYTYQPAAAQTMEDEIDMPPILEKPLAMITAAVLSGDLPGAEARAETSALQCKRRLYDNFKQSELWGGYRPCC